MGANSTLRVWEETREVRIALESAEEEPQAWKGTGAFYGPQKGVGHVSFMWYDYSLVHKPPPTRCACLCHVAPGMTPCQKLYR